jgi:CheY-like chemotaxis protein
VDATDIISDAGYAVEAGSVDEAFDFLQSHASLQLLFTDVQTLGEMNGFALAGEVAERWPRICVVVTSNWNRQQRQDALDARSKVRESQDPLNDSAILPLSFETMTSYLLRPAPLGPPWTPRCWDFSIRAVRVRRHRHPACICAAVGGAPLKTRRHRRRRLQTSHQDQGSGGSGVHGT